MMSTWKSCRPDGRACGRAIVGAWLVAIVAAAWSGTTGAAQAQRTVFDGVYTDAQAERGKAAYEKDCAFCHLEDLSGQGFAPGLVEDIFKHRWEDGTVGDLYAVIKATMPQDKPESLTEAQYADIVAYLLKANKFPAGQEELKPDPAALKGVAFKK
jgi:mono/diheme cytochrome c family protein